MSNGKLKRIGDNASIDLTNYGGARQVPFSVVDYAGNGTVQSEIVHSKDRTLTTTITNNSTESQKVAVFLPSFLYLVKSEDGVVEIDGEEYIVLKEGTQNIGTEQDPVDFSVATKRTAYQYAIDYVRRKTARLISLRVSAQNISDNSPNPLQFATTMKSKVDNPLVAKVDSKEINLQEWFSEKQFQDGILTVNDGFTVDDSSIVTWEIAPQTRVSITMYFGPVVNFGKALEKMVQSSGLAFNDGERAGLPGIRFKK